jgi:hypothetical protein
MAGREQARGHPGAHPAEPQECNALHARSFAAATTDDKADGALRSVGGYNVRTGRIGRPNQGRPIREALLSSWLGLFAISWLASCAGAGQVPEQRTEVRAPIVRVAVRVAESFPPQYFADVTSALPDGCAEFSRFAVRREAAAVLVDVFNTRPASSQVACTMIYGEKETAVPLGSDFRSGETYSLDVNGRRESFVAQ